MDYAALQPGTRVGLVDYRPPMQERAYFGEVVRVNKKTLTVKTDGRTGATSTYDLTTGTRRYGSSYSGGEVKVVSVDDPRFQRLLREQRVRRLWVRVQAISSNQDITLIEEAMSSLEEIRSQQAILDRQEDEK